MSYGQFLGFAIAGLVSSLIFFVLYNVRMSYGVTYGWRNTFLIGMFISGISSFIFLFLQLHFVGEHLKGEGWIMFVISIVFIFLVCCRKLLEYFGDPFDDRNVL